MESLMCVVRRLPGLALLVACAVGTLRAQTTPTPARITVIGNDYTFVQFPATIAAGPTLFSFENRGKVKHEMSVLLLKPGFTMQQVMEMPPAAPSSRAVAERIIGVLLARVGESSGGQLLADLRPGQRYLVICTLKDPPDTRRHADMGMVATFDVP
jgi:hypothetical protein